MYYVPTRGREGKMMEPDSCSCAKGPALECKCDTYDQVDTNYALAHHMLLELHIEKSRRYGNNNDKLNNFVQVAAATGHDEIEYPVERIIEKCIRVLEIVRNGVHAEVQEMDELTDIAGLALCAESLRMRGHPL
jgi:hypothetical protein